MGVRSMKCVALLLLAGMGICVWPGLRGQEAVAPPPVAEPAAVPKGIEVMARGPIHEAFATPTAEPVPTKAVPKQPPKPLNELPPDEKPEGDMSWIGGYWHWDDERTDFIWVSGIWRSIPRGRQWVAGYWREEGSQSQYVSGYWAEAAAQPTATREVTYLPTPPAPPQVAPPGEPPDDCCFYVPGHYVWVNDHYGWKAGYWAHVVPGYVWVPHHYRWTPSGYVYIVGYWDLGVSRRGVLYAPVVVDHAAVGVSFVYTPAYAVSDTIVLDALFVRPSCCHYYFGDYYGVSYREYGYESCVVYSRRNYDSIIVYERYEHRREPEWINLQINVYNDRYAGRAPLPPRTLVQQNTIIQQNIIQQNVVNNNTVVNNVTNVNTVNNVTNTPVLIPTSKLAAARGTRTVPVDTTTRVAARQQSQEVQQVAQQRRQSEVAVPGGAPTRARVATLTNAPMPPISPGVMQTGARSDFGKVLTPGNPGQKPIVDSSKMPALTGPGTTTKPGVTAVGAPTQQLPVNSGKTMVAPPPMQPAPKPGVSTGASIAAPPKTSVGTQGPPASMQQGPKTGAPGPQPGAGPMPPRGTPPPPPPPAREDPRKKPNNGKPDPNQKP